MPYGAMVLSVYYYVLPEMRLQQLEQQRMDDDGMIERFVSLEGLDAPRMLSWAELRALRNDLQEVSAANRWIAY